jgi:lysophospholipase L1-like esterase
VFGVAGALAIAEAFLRVHDPLGQRLRGNVIVLPAGKRVVVEQRDAPKLEPVIVHTRNSLGFRGADPPADFDERLTIVAVGGSTTECMYLSDGKDWPAVVGRRLEPSFPSLWMNNSGLNGHSTFGHLLLLRQHLVALRPKVIVMMAGINDVARDDLGDYDTMQLGPRSVLERLAQHSATASLLLNVSRARRASAAGLLHRQLDLASWPSKDMGRRPDGDGLLAYHRRKYLPAYRQRVQLFTRLSREAGIDVVLVTQPALYGPAVDDATGVDLGRIGVSPDEGVNGALSWEILELYNGVLRDVGGAEGLAVIDLGRAMGKSSRLYYDFLHFTVEGADAAAAIVAPALCEHLARRFPDRLARPCDAGGGSR